MRPVLIDLNVEGLTLHLEWRGLFEMLLCDYIVLERILRGVILRVTLDSQDSTTFRGDRRSSLEI